MISANMFERIIFEGRIKNTSIGYALLTLTNPINIYPAITTVFNLFIKNLRLNPKFLTNEYIVLKLSSIPKQLNYLTHLYWDMLIILDACRYDYFTITLNKYLSLLNRSIIRITPVLSPASFTGEWLKKVLLNISDKKNIVIITSNPFYEKLKLSKLFFHIEPVWNYGFDHRLGTVPPNKVVETFIKIVNQYNDKKFILHFMQPHFPSLDGQVPIAENRVIAKLVGMKKLSKSTVKMSYLRNLHIAFEYALASIAVGKIVGMKQAIITSDHGDLVEFGGHPCNIQSTMQTLIPLMELDITKFDINTIIKKSRISKMTINKYIFFRKIYDLKKKLK